MYARIITEYYIETAINVTLKYIGSNSSFVCAALRLTNQFSEFYHNATDAKQGLRHIVNQLLYYVHPVGICSANFVIRIKTATCT